MDLRQRQRQVDVVFIDFSKAFHLVCHNIPLTKLYKYGVHVHGVEII